MQKWGDQMSKKSKATAEAERGRLNLTLPPELCKKLDAYILKVANKQGKMPPQGIKTTIGRMALDEWLDKHNDDLDIDFAA